MHTHYSGDVLDSLIRPLGEETLTIRKKIQRVKDYRKVRSRRNPGLSASLNLTLGFSLSDFQDTKRPQLFPAADSKSVSQQFEHIKIDVTTYSNKWKAELRKLQAEHNVETLTEKLSEIMMCDEANK